MSCLLTEGILLISVTRQIKNMRNMHFIFQYDILFICRYCCVMYKYNHSTQCVMQTHGFKKFKNDQIYCDKNYLEYKLLSEI